MVLNKSALNLIVQGSLLIDISHSRTTYPHASIVTGPSAHAVIDVR